MTALVLSPGQKFISAWAIKTLIREGYDTIEIGQRFGLKESEVWNVLARAEKASA